MASKDDEPGPAWQKWVAFGVLVAALACVVIFRRHLSADFIPLDSSRVGPNLIASVVQWVVIFTAAVLLWPPWRRRLHRFIDRKVAPLDAKVDKLEEHHKALAVRHDEHAESLKSLHQKLDALAAARPVLRVKATRPPAKPKEPK